MWPRHRRSRAPRSVRHQAHLRGRAKRRARTVHAADDRAVVCVACGRDAFPALLTTRIARSKLPSFCSTTLFARLAGTTGKVTQEAFTK
jgi:hypothetical protein